MAICPLDEPWQTAIFSFAEQEEIGLSRVLVGRAPIAQTRPATAPGVKGLKHNTDPLAAGGLLLAEPWDATDVRFVEPALRTPSKSAAFVAVPAGW